MGNEDTLSGFPVKEAVPALVSDEREREREREGEGEGEGERGEGEGGRVPVSLYYCFIVMLDSLAFNGTQF